MARAFFCVKCSFGLCLINLGDGLLPGVVGVDGGCDDVESPPAVTAAVAVSLVKGERVFDGDDRTISREDEAASRFYRLFICTADGLALREVRTLCQREILGEHRLRDLSTWAPYHEVDNSRDATVDTAPPS